MSTQYQSLLSWKIFKRTLSWKHCDLGERHSYSYNINPPACGACSLEKPLKLKHTLMETSPGKDTATILITNPNQIQPHIVNILIYWSIYIHLYPFGEEETWTSFILCCLCFCFCFCLRFCHCHLFAWELILFAFHLEKRQEKVLYCKQTEGYCLGPICSQDKLLNR